jgi:hypothetical protein
MTDRIPPTGDYPRSMRRVRQGPEKMDDPDVPRRDLATALRFIRFINRRLGGERALLQHLRAWSCRWPKDRPVTLLDVATGSADLPIAAVRWARRAGFDLRVTGIDVHATTLELAREHLARNEDVAGSIHIEQVDALRLMDRFASRSFDYVHAGLFLHHLGDVESLTMLSIMDKLARAGIVWNDLSRSRLALAATHLITLPTPSIVRHDAVVSVRAGFDRAEVEAMAKRLDLSYARYRLDFGAQRFTLAGEKPGAW